MANGLTYSRRVTSVEETKDLARTLAPFLRMGDMVMLNGGLGAGKTQFVQAVAVSFGISENVMSPTFNIVLSYQGREYELNHFDLYRLDSQQELEDIGYWEMIEGDGVNFVEWGDKFPHSMPLDYLEIRIEVESATDRIIKCRAHGERARRLLFLWANNPDAFLEPVPDYKRFI